MPAATTALKPIFCCRLNFLSVNGNLGRGERIDDNVFITNDRLTIESLMPETFLPAIGRMEYRSFRESPVAAYARLDDLEPGSEHARLLEHLLLLDTFEHVFRLQADSNVGHDVAFLIDKARGGIWSNIFEGRRCRSDSSQETLTIGAGTLRELLEAYRLLLKPGKQKPALPSATEGHSSPKAGLMAEVSKGARLRLARVHTKANSNRVSRAMSHVGRAQKTGVFTEKVTFYCSALETLFSSSQFEITHQIAERVAVVSSSAKSDRLETYRFVKSCYAFRSKYIHGAAVREDDEPKLEAMCRQLDGIVRSCFHKVLGEDEDLCRVLLSGGDLDELMLEKLFQ